MTKLAPNQMPAFGMDKTLTKKEIEDVASHIMSLSNKNLAKNKNGEKIFQTNCVACHGNNAKGNQQLGAPNLTDKIWLYGGNKEDIIFTVTYSRNGVMPYWNSRLDDATIKQLTLLYLFTWRRK